MSCSCKASGIPKPKVRWFLEDKPLQFTGELLEIDNVLREDAGMYRCLADNTIGRPAHEYIKIDIVCKYLFKLSRNYRCDVQCYV